MGEQCISHLCMKFVGMQLFFDGDQAGSLLPVSPSLMPSPNGPTDFPPDDPDSETAAGPVAGQRLL